MCKIEFRCIWLINCCVQGLFQTGGIIKKSATSGVEGGLGSGEICISSKLSSWEGAVMLGDGVEQGGNKHNYNHGQKSWDKFTFVALFHTRQTNSSTLVQPLPLPPSYNIGRVFTLFLQSVNIVLGVGGRKQRILKRIRVLF